MDASEAALSRRGELLDRICRTSPQFGAALIRARALWWAPTAARTNPSFLLSHLKEHGASLRNTSNPVGDARP